MRKHPVLPRFETAQGANPLRSPGRRAKRKIRSEARSNVTPAGCRKISRDPRQSMKFLLLLPKILHKTKI